MRLLKSETAILTAFAIDRIGKAQAQSAKVTLQPLLETPARRLAIRLG